MIIELEPDLAARLTEEAARRGMDPEALVLKTLEDRWPPDGKEYGHLQRSLSPDEWARNAESFASGHEPWPDVPDEALTREGIYEDHP